jgi:hypothetical protein
MYLAIIVIILTIGVPLVWGITYMNAKHKRYR